MRNLKLLAFCSLSVALAACVSDSPVNTTTGNDAGGGTDDGGTPDTGGPTPDAASDAPADAPLTCNQGLTACGGKCVDTSISDKNCGTCGHDCGGVGLCADGACRPQVIRDQIANGPVQMTVDDNGVYFFAQNDGAFELHECPLTGCTQAPTVVATMINYYYGVAAQPGTLLFTNSDQSTKERSTLFYCDDTGCPSSSTVISSQKEDQDGLAAITLLGLYGQDAYYIHQGNHSLRHAVCSAGKCGAYEQILSTSTTAVKMLTGDGKNVYFIDGNDGLESCPGSGACTPTIIASGGQNAVGIAAQATTLYLLFSGASGYQNGFIRSCSTSGACTLSVLLKNIAYPTALTATPLGPVWFAKDVGNLQTCPTQNCVAPQNVVTKLSNVGLEQLQSNGNFVYWVQNGSAVNTKAIFRVAL